VSGSDILILGAIVVLVLLLIILAIAETGLNRISRVKAQAIDENTQSKSSAALRGLVEQPERFINPLLVTVTALQTVQVTLTTILFVNLLGGALGAIVGAVVNTVVIFVLAESMPKTWAILHPERAGLVTARFTQGLITFWPLRIVSRLLIGLTNVLLPGKGLKEGPFVSEQELLGIVGAAADDEVIEHEERELIESIIEFGDTVAREVMVPRPDMITVDEDATVTGALDVAIDHGNSRLPLRGGEDGDDIVGIVYTKDLIRAEREGRGDTPAADLSREVKFIPENKPVARLMREMQAEKFHLAIVADEYGDVVGLITLEDCLEELVGEIIDEYDIEELSIRPLPDGDHLVDGGVQVEELNDVLDAHLPDEEWDTVGGMLFGTLEHVPEPGESVELGGFRFTAEELDGRRIKLVRVARVEVSAPIEVDEVDTSDA
jgi:CBS domain containing-hemolysin-like protein